MSLSIPPSFGVVRGQDLNGGSSDKLPTLPAVAKRNWGQQLWAWEPLPFRRREDEIKRVEHQRWTGRTVTPLTRGAAVSLPSRLHLDHRGSRGQWTSSGRSVLAHHGMADASPAAMLGHTHVSDAQQVRLAHHTSCSDGLDRRSRITDPQRPEPDALESPDNDQIERDIPS